MEVILLERIEKLGQMGDVVSVKPGYARNYLLPQNKAVTASEDNRAHYESQRTQLEAHNPKDVVLIINYEYDVYMDTNFCINR